MSCVSKCYTANWNVLSEAVYAADQQEEDPREEDQKKDDQEADEWDMKGNCATVERLTDDLSMKGIGVNVNCLSEEWNKNVNGVNVKCLNVDSVKSGDDVERLLADWSEAGEE